MPMLPVRRYKEKLLWLALVLCLVSCDYTVKDPPQAALAEVEYSNDWKFITLFLDGATAETVAAKSASASRVMTADTARVGFDFFEVVFFSGGTIARTSWEHGSPVSLNGVRRGVTYSHNGANRAILFAGRNVDKTLLAVGKLYSVDNVRGTRVDSDSSFVTFEVHALTGGASHDPEISSFLLAGDSVSQPAVDTTTILNAHIGTRDFPLYCLAGGQQNVRASYELLLDGAEWKDFESNFLISVAGFAEKREPRYSLGNNNYRYALYDDDLTTLVTMTNNQVLKSYAQSPITFSFDTRETYLKYPNSYKNGIFSLIFEVPIYAYTDLPGAGNNTAIEWAIRPAYGTYLYSLDNGILYKDTIIVGNWGGAVLIGVNADVADMIIPDTWG